MESKQLPTVIEELLSKSNYTYDELRKNIKNSMQELDQDVWEVNIDMLKLSFKPTDKEVFDLIRAFLVYEYNEKAVHLTLNTKDNTVTIERDKMSIIGLALLLFIALLFTGLIVLMSNTMF